MIGFAPAKVGAQEFACCGKFFTSAKGLNTHIGMMHKSEKALNTHIGMMHKEVLYHGYHGCHKIVVEPL